MEVCGWYVEGLSGCEAMLLLWRVLHGYYKPTVVVYGIRWSSMLCMYYKVLLTGIWVELGYPEYKTVHTSQSVNSQW